MNGLRCVMVPALIAVFAASAGAQPFSDNFNDNDLGDQWITVQPSENLTVENADERLEFTFLEKSGFSDVAGIVGKFWWFDPAQPFRFRITGRFDPELLEGDVGLQVGFSNSASIFSGVMEDGVVYYYGANNVGPFSGYNRYRGGRIRGGVSVFPFVRDEGTAYFEWDGETLCASLVGYGEQVDTLCVMDPFAGIDEPVRISAPVVVFFGAYADGSTAPVDPSEAWMDNLIIDEGLVRFVEQTEELEEELEEQPELPTGPDADENGRVELDDIVIFLERGANACSILPVLQFAGFDPTNFSINQWTKLMNGVVKHRIAPFLKPRPTREQRDRWVQILVGAYACANFEEIGAGAVTDTGTTDANGDGLIDFGDVARILEAGDADPDRLLEVFMLIGVDPAEFPRAKDWKNAAKAIYEVLVDPEFAFNRDKKQTKKDVKVLYKLR